MKKGKFWVFAVVGIISNLIGFGLLHLFIELLGFGENISNIFQLVIVFQINFVLNMKYTWKDMPEGFMDFFRKWGGYHLTRLVSALAGVIVFAILNLILPYGWAYWLMVGTVAGLNYLGLDKFIFNKR